MAVEIIVTLDELLVQRNMSGRELAGRIGMTEPNLSLLRTGKVRGMRFETLAKICEVLDCAPGDLLRRQDHPAPSERTSGSTGGLA